MGSLHGQFRRLGLGGPGWRLVRLDITAALTGRADLGSIRMLSVGEAGQLLRTLAGCRDCRDLVCFLAWSVEEQREQDGTSLASASPAG